MDEREKMALILFIVSLSITGIIVGVRELVDYKSNNEKQLLTANFTIQTLNASLQTCANSYASLNAQCVYAINQSSAKYDNLLAECRQAIQELQKR